MHKSSEYKKIEMMRIALTSIGCLVFYTMPMNSLKSWTYANDGYELRRRSVFRSHRTSPNSYYTHSTSCLEDARADLLAKYGTQVYGVPTFDPLFKLILDDPEVRPSFFHALVPGINVSSSERLDENMDPLQEFQLLRKFVNSNDTKKVIENLRNSSEFEVRIKKNNKFTQFGKGTDLLAELLNYFGDIIKGFPTENYDGKMDFVCQLDTGEYILVETQVVKKDFWDMRALAYTALCYGKQICKGGKWKDIKKVIGINILGGGIDEQNPWKDAPDLIFFVKVVVYISSIL